MAQASKKIVKSLEERCDEFYEDSIYLRFNFSNIHKDDLIDSLNESSNPLPYFHTLFSSCFNWSERYSYSKNSKAYYYWIKAIEKSKIPKASYFRQALDITEEQGYLKPAFKKDHPFSRYNYKKALIQYHKPWIIEFADSLTYPSYILRDYIVDSENIEVLNFVNDSLLDDKMRDKIVDLAIKQKKFYWARYLLRNVNSMKSKEIKIDAGFELGIQDSISNEIQSFVFQKYNEDSNRIIPKELKSNPIKFYKLHKERIYYGTPPVFGPEKWLKYVKICANEGNWKDCQTFLIKSIYFASKKSYGYNNSKEIKGFAQTLYNKNIKLTDDFKKWFPLTLH